MDCLYWDDILIFDDFGIGQFKNGQNGCSCVIDGCCIWNNFDVNIIIDDCMDVIDDLIIGYGDKNILNIWWFVNVIIVMQVDIFILSCQIIGDSMICGNGIIVLEVVILGMVGNFIYIWSGFDGFSSFDVFFGLIFVFGEYCVIIMDG